MARRESDSEYHSETFKVVALRNFEGVAVGTAAGKVPLISKCQFYQAPADSIATRLLPESEKALCKAVEVLDVAAFANEVPPEY